MSFTISKILLYLILPPSGILILLIIGLILMKKRHTAGSMCIMAGIVLLYGLSIDPVSDALIGRLERDQPPLAAIPADIDAIVVLSGGVKELPWEHLASEPSSYSLERLVGGVSLYKRAQKPLVLSGGSGLPGKKSITEADTMAQVAVSLGVPRKDILIENRSRNTVESAAAVRSMLTGTRIIVVTSAFHMKRSLAMFRKAGFDAVAVPVGYQGERRPFTVFSVIPTAGSLGKSFTALREHVSYFWYAIQGDV